jgi:3-hydroxyisobutyrate dehydrogenase-like beta-hydroxyacid dehydrogenase
VFFSNLDVWELTIEKPLFSVDGAIKDCTHALGIAEKSGAKMPGVEMAVAHLKAVKEHQGDSGDLAGIYGAIRKDSGLSFNNDGSG